MHLRISCAAACLLAASACSSSENLPPIARAGMDVVAEVELPVALDGSGSSDPDGNIQAYQWRLMSAPDGANPTLEGSQTVAPTFTADVDGIYALGLAVTDGSGLRSAPDLLSVIVSTPLSGPKAQLAVSGDLVVGGTVTLDGSGSSDPDDDPLTYDFSLVLAPPGAAAEIETSPEDPLATIVPDLAGAWVFSLRVSDGEFDSGRVDALVVIEVEGETSGPVASCGGDQEAMVGDTVQLDGSASADPDGDALTFSWTLDLPDGSASALDDATVDSPSFVPDLDGDYLATLQVDSVDGTDSCQTLVHVVTTTEDLPPVCDGGGDQSVAVGDTVSLDGSGSVDPEGGPLTFAWSLDAVPAGSAAILDDPTSPTPTFLADLAGDYEATLVVDDGVGSCTTAVTITASIANNPPVCDAGPDQTAYIGDKVTLDGSNTIDPDGDPLTWSWTFRLQPGSSTATISGSGKAVASFVADVAGTFKARLRAYDATDKCYDDAVIKVTRLNNIAPVADAGADAESCGLSTITVDGSASSDGDGDALTYTWTVSATPAGSAISTSSLLGASTATASFTPDVAGDYTLKLKVDDGTDTASDTVTVSTGESDAAMMLHLDEISGTTALDSSGEGNGGTLTGGSWVGARFMGGLAFDGSSSVDVVDADGLDLVDEFSIDWWMRTDSLSSDYEVVLMKGYPSNYAVLVNGDALDFSGLMTDGTYAILEVTPGTLGDGGFHHYAVVGSAGTLTIYVDGSTAGSTTLAADLEANADDLVVGRPSFTTTSYFLHGTVDELVLRQRALDPTEVADLADSETQVCSGDQDQDAPLLTINSPVGSSSTSVPWVKVEGTAWDESAIVSLQVEGIDAIATSDNYATWAAWLPLEEGTWSFEVVAEDIAGNTAAATSGDLAYADSCGQDDLLLLSFEEEVAGTAADWGTMGLDATESNVVRAAGLHGNAAWFDGTATISVPASSALALDGAFTIDWWFRKDAVATGWEVMLSRVSPVNYAAGFYKSFLAFGFTRTDGVASYTYASGFEDGAWHHAAGVFDGSNILLYVDGALESSIPVAAPPDATGTGGVYLGSLGGTARPYTGYLDQVRIQDVALDDTEIAALYEEREACAVSEDLALGATATASSTRSATYAADHVIDGDTDELVATDTTMWLAADATAGSVDLDLGEVIGITEVRWANTHNATNMDRATLDWLIEVSVTGEFDGEQVEWSSGTGALEDVLVFHSEVSGEILPARYLRFSFETWSGDGGGINEIDVRGLR